MHKNSTKNTMFDVELVNEIYSTQQHDEKWPRLLDRLYPIANARSAGLAVIEKSDDSTAGLFHTFNTNSTNVDPVIEEKYLKEYSHLEINHIKLTMESSVGVMVVDPDFDDYDLITQRPDVKFAMENMDIFHRVGIRLNDEHVYSDIIAFQLPTDRRENFTPKEIAPVLNYVPHLAQAINLGRIYDAIRQRYKAVLSMLDRVNIGMVLMGNAGSIVVANLCAQEIIDRSSRLDITKRGYLQVTDSKIDLYFQSRIRLLQESRDQSEKSIIRLGDDNDDSDLVLELSPLLDSDSDVSNGFLGVMAIIIDPNRPYLALYESISSVFSLTKAESDVAQLIANGNSYKEIAERRGVGRETVKTQAGNLMRKMNVSSRAGVVRKLMNLGISFNESGNPS